MKKFHRKKGFLVASPEPKKQSTTLINLENQRYSRVARKEIKLNGQAITGNLKVRFYTVYLRYICFSSIAKVTGYLNKKEKLNFK